MFIFCIFFLYIFKCNGSSMVLTVTFFFSKKVKILHKKITMPTALSKSLMHLCSLPKSKKKSPVLSAVFTCERIKHLPACRRLSFFPITNGRNFSLISCFQKQQYCPHCCDFFWFQFVCCQAKELKGNLCQVPQTPCCVSVWTLNPQKKDAGIPE